MTYNLFSSFGKKIKIKFLTLNDTYQTNYFGRWAQKADEIIFNELEPTTIFVKVFGGDYLFLSKFSAILQGHDMVLAGNASKFDVVGIGNHEFDGGKPVLTELALMAETPIICSNLTKDILVQFNLKDNISFSKNGIKFGAISYLTQEASQISSGARDLKFQDINYIFETQKEFLLSQNIRILVFHDDIDNIINYFNTHPENKELVDVIVTGHQHIIYTGYIDRCNYRIPIVQMGQDAYGLGYIELEYNECFKCLTNSFVDVIVIPPTFPETKEISLLTKWVDEVSAPYFKKTIGVVVDYPLDGLRFNIRNQETNIGDLVSDAFLFTGKKTPLDGPKENIFSVSNSGGIRNNSILPIGFEVTGETVYNILPFQNDIVALEIIGRTNVNNLINYLAVTSFSNKNTPRWLQVSKNIIFNYQTKTYELVGGTQGETDKFYLMVYDFLANGGDGYTELQKLKKFELDIPSQNSLIDYILSLGGNISYTTDYTRIILP